MIPVYRVLPTDLSPLRVVHSLAPVVMLVSIYQTDLDPPRPDVELIPNVLGCWGGSFEPCWNPVGRGAAVEWLGEGGSRFYLQRGG